MLKLAIGNEVEVPVKFTLKEGKVNKNFAFTLFGKRLDQDEITARLDACDLKFKPFLQSEGLIYGWEGQRLVVGDDGTPAEFSEEALSVMLSAPGVAQVCFVAYQKECAAKEKN